MIGLESIARVFDKQAKEIAEELGCSKQTVSGWINEKTPIADKWKKRLSQMFGLPEAFFSKKLNRVELIDVEIAYLRKLNEENKVIVEEVVDGELNKQKRYPYQGEIWFLEQQREKEVLLLETGELLDFDSDNELDEYMNSLPYDEALKTINYIFKTGEQGHIQAVTLLLELLTTWGKPRSKASKGLIYDMTELLKKHNITPSPIERK
ncbi:helix-turn-helix domain-containing protein [Domibacillus tundrae]|uniref:helix-turn-helix domain-containing protein n=1 Tax=Domibacillus tundrae TaxID=1587527 RepID=UPI000617E9D2|nr:helix-turn-helix transcriptional regulator [Domibacillus tundrae]